MRQRRNKEEVRCKRKEAGHSGIGQSGHLMKPVSLLRVVVAIGAFALPAQAQFIISDATDLFAPSFRDGTNADLNNTTWWGWSAGSFDQPVDNELIDAPPPTLGVGGLDGTLNQLGSSDILSSGNNIYTAFTTTESLALEIPTNGTIGTGFTTIIVQAQTTFFGPNSGWNGTPGVFGDIAGVAPAFVHATNAASLGQLWAKYEITGNASSYTLNWALTQEHTSVAKLTVDTQWSSTGFASDSAAAIPEPSAWILISLGCAAAVLLRRGRPSTSEAGS
jgi:hypothetical protein